jgi:hypothetical protein
MKKSSLLIFLLIVPSFCPLYGTNNLSLIISKNNYPISLIRVNDSKDSGIKRKIMITAGVGLNLLGRNLQKTYLKSSNYSFIGNIESHKTSAMFNAGVDYGIRKKISVGAAFGYQKAVINLMHLDNTDDRYFDSWKRVYLALRGDYFLRSKENFDLYSGVSIGYNKYTVTSNVPDTLYPDYLENMDVKPSELTVQGHVGFHYYIKRVGFNAEAGFGYGAPIIGTFGLTVKF